MNSSNILANLPKIPSQIHTTVQKRVTVSQKLHAYYFIQLEFQKNHLNLVLFKRNLNCRLMLNDIKNLLLIISILHQG